MAKPTLRTNHSLSLSVVLIYIYKYYIYIYYMNLYTCIQCLYLYMCVFRWRNPHLEQTCPYPYNIYLYKNTHLNLYTCIRLCLYLYMCVFRWRNPHLEHHILSFSIIYSVYIHTLDPIHICLSLYLYMYVFRWRNPHIEQITFCRYP